MDLQVYAVIVIVFLVSLCSLLFVNKQLRGGKTYEEVLAEKRQFAEKLYGPKKKNTKKTNAGGKKNRDRNSNKEKSPKPQTSSVESDQKSESGSELEQTIEQPKLHVEFTEAEIIGTDTNTITFKRQLSTGKLNTQAARKNSATKPPGTSILVNKSTNGNAAKAINVNGAIEPLNNFEKILPKDDLEIKKQRDESIGRTANAATKKDGKKVKPNNKKDASPSIEKVTTLGSQHHETVDGHLNVPVTELATVAVTPRDSPKNIPNKEKSNKKKRNDALLVQKLVDAGVASSTVDDVNVNGIITLLGRSELTRGEIQILIDFLLNKQQDTANVTHSDWSDDIANKLRKQLEEKDRVLAEEQKASLALHQKLREMRAEWNAERIANVQKLNANAAEIGELKLDLNQLQQEAQLTNERHAVEKQQLNTHLQQKLFQEKNNQNQETAQKIQQLTDANALTAAELLSKNAIIQDLQEKFMRIRDESLKKIADYEQKFQEYVHKSESDVAHLTAENQQLRAECQRKDEYEKLFAIQKYECESLEARLAEQSKVTSQMDDNSKVEIRNLQNALDSTKAELTQRSTELTDGQTRVAELTNELIELKKSFESESRATDQKHSKLVEDLNESLQLLKSQVNDRDQQIIEYKTKLEDASADKREEELFKQIADYKEKNNELRKKNWKLVDALQKVEESAFKISSKCNLVASNSANQVSTSPSKQRTTVIDPNADLIVRTQQAFERVFPNVPSTTDYDAWLANIANHIEQLNQQQFQSNHQSLQNNNSKPKVANVVVSTNGDEASAANVSAASNGNHLNDNGATATTQQNPNDELVLQNAKLKTTVDEYKTIIAETEGLLTHLEKKVKEQDSYWRSVVQTKDGEIRSLQQNTVPST